MFQLRVNDLARLKSLAIAAKYDQAIINQIDAFEQNIADKSNITRNLLLNEVKSLAAHKHIKRLMILLFLAENVSLLFLKTTDKQYNKNKVLVKDYWDQIEETLINRLKISRDFAPFFESTDQNDLVELNRLLLAARTIEIIDLCTEEFVSRSGDIRIQLNISGKYDLQQIKAGEKKQAPAREEFDLYERKTYCHVGIYDAFNFAEPDVLTAFRYPNNSPTKGKIDSLITLKFAIPVLFALNIDGSFTEIPYDEIPSFIETNYKHKEIDKESYEGVKEDYPQLFQPVLDNDSIKSISHKISHLINPALLEAKKNNRPLLIILSEVHGSKGSFILHLITLTIARNLGINHLLAETINIYHKKWGSDPLVEEMVRLLSFAENELGMKVKDLEKQLHYKNELSPYPYYEIPLDTFGIPVREASWFIDVMAVKESAVLIIGCGHMNSMINSELQEMYHVLPIDCSYDKPFSDMLGISQHNFIDLNRSLIQLSLDQIISMVQKTIR